MPTTPKLVDVIDNYIDAKIFHAHVEAETRRDLGHLYRLSDDLEDARLNAERWRDVLAMSLAALKIDKIPE